MVPNGRRRATITSVTHDRFFAPGRPDLSPGRRCAVLRRAAGLWFPGRTGVVRRRPCLTVGGQAGRRSRPPGRRRTWPSNCSATAGRPEGSSRA
jgi:hypothetical protein